MSRWLLKLKKKKEIQEKSLIYFLLQLKAHENNFRAKGREENLVPNTDNEVIKFLLAQQT